MTYTILAEDRKTVVNRIGELIGTRLIYTKMPRCAYEAAGFSVEKDKTLVANDGADQNVVSTLIAEGLIEGAAMEMDTEAMATETEQTEDIVEMAATPEEHPMIAENTEADTLAEAVTPEEHPMIAENAEAETLDEDETPEEHPMIAENAEVDTLGDADAPTENDPADPEQESEEADVPADADSPCLSICFPYARHTGTSLRNLVNTIYSRGSLLSKATGGTFGADKELVDLLKEDSLTFTTERMLKTIRDYTKAHPDALRGLTFAEDKICFDGFPENSLPEEMDAWVKLAEAINRAAITQTRIQAKAVSEDNEKYVFRCWMLRLGLNGAEFKAARKILMRNLDGNSAFPTEDGADRFKAKMKAQRDAAKAEREARNNAVEVNETADQPDGVDNPDEPDEQAQ